MLTEQQLHGIYMPIITPFLPNGELDLESFHKLSSSLVTQGIHGLVVNGTTGESPTVSHEEMSLLAAAAKSAIGAADVPLVLGTGTNDTRASVKKTELAGKLGADAVLAVVPYYNKPSQRGIIEHFRKIAEVGVPVMVYEIPSRTGIRMEIDTVRTILDMDGIVGMKDCSGSTELLRALQSFGSVKPVLSGDDTRLLDFLEAGAAGGMLASAHVRTGDFLNIYRSFREGHIEEAQTLFDELTPLMHLLFEEPNPAPVKWLLAELGQISHGTLRLPMVEIGEELQAKLLQTGVFPGDALAL
ncbi:4-hydroxy-tetrahydrodipicolinate synthase [Saccharibacillus kuerlensis]|uniref:4-hydroxy-tetrahydrodipicolinate synthase n=1 Tax=Saccharibacillus kuerlensis TaxID=459527 RepID=A0ABQ2L3K5_9BACL|nr:4-hydroxy-tetrahydrodipicolinate synthase [Saccharibacillus kuerlensis]GGO01350.1 4-hydroxy-tetrahydrodipicolinate synthase 2 [Saccharibacillus kuerlensis]